MAPIIPSAAQRMLAGSSAAAAARAHNRAGRERNNPCSFYQYGKVIGIRQAPPSPRPKRRTIVKSVDARAPHRQNRLALGRGPAAIPQVPSSRRQPDQAAADPCRGRAARLTPASRRRCLNRNAQKADRGGAGRKRALDRDHGPEAKRGRQRAVVDQDQVNVGDHSGCGGAFDAQRRDDQRRAGRPASARAPA